MFRTLIHPSLGACGCVVQLPHRSSCSQFVVCWRFGAAPFGWCSFCRLKQTSTCKTNTTQNQPHQISNTQRTENKTTDVVTEQHRRKLLMMDVLMSETCWAHKKWNKIASDIKLVFRSSSTCRYIFYHLPHYHLHNHYQRRRRRRRRRRVAFSTVRNGGAHFIHRSQKKPSSRICNSKRHGINVRFSGLLFSEINFVVCWPRSKENIFEYFQDKK